MELKERVKKLNEKTFSTEEVINILLYIILCVLPLWIGFAGNDRYYYPKSVLLNIIGFLLLILMIKEKVKLNRKEDKLCLVFLGWIILSSINAMDLERAITGGIWRYEGVITFISYGIIFIAASRYLHITKKRINIFMISGAIVAIIYIFQSKGFDPLKYLIEDKDRMSSLIGNRNFLSSYVLMFLSISMTAYIFWSKKRYLMYSCIFFTALICSLTRGGWISLVLISLVGLGFIRKDMKRLKRAGIIIVSFIVLFVGINSSRQGVLTNRIETIKTDIEKMKDTSEEKSKKTSIGSGRIGIYMGAIEMIKERPLLGTGVGCFWNGFELDAPKEVLESWEKSNQIVDKAHNEILNIAATSGIPAALAYICLVGIILFKLWKKRKDDKVKLVFLVLFGYVIQANFNISVVSVAPLFWIILGKASARKEILN